MPSRAKYKKNLRAVAKQRLVDNPTKLPQRPSIFDPGMCEAVIQMKTDEGFSDSEMISYLGVSRDTYYRWVRERPDFAEAVSIGKVGEEAWFDKVGRMGVLGQIKGFNGTAYAILRNGLHGWNKGQNAAEVNFNINQVNVLQGKSMDDLLSLAKEKLERLESLNPALLEALPQDKIKQIYEHSDGSN